MMAPAESAPFPDEATARVLAAAIRKGVESRLGAVRTVREQRLPIALPNVEDPLAVLGNLTGVLHLAPDARPGWKRPFIRLARRIGRCIMRPWFELQTRFNETTFQIISYLWQTLDRRILSVLQQRLQIVENTLVNLQLALRENGVAETARHSGPAVVPPASVDSSELLERLFVQFHLTRNARQVLIVTDGPTAIVNDLAGFGYETVVADEVTAMKFPSASFDVVIRCGNRPLETRPDQFLASLARSLRPFGRLLLTLSRSDAMLIPVELLLGTPPKERDHLPLRTLDQRVATLEGGHWRFSVEGEPGSSWPIRYGALSMTLLALEKT